MGNDTFHHGKSWKIMENHGKSWKIMENQWEIMENHGKSMENQWEMWVFHKWEYPLLMDGFLHGKSH